MKTVFNKKSTQLWSSGFITTPNTSIKPIKDNLFVSSVRGLLSKDALDRLYGNKFNITVGDAGLLARELISPTTQKRYSLGIIPHIREIDEEKYKEIQKNVPRSIIVDVREDPITIIKKISQCDCIISSSLHGLVVADSLGIPNKQVHLTNNLLGDGFKFRDYYSVFGLRPSPININYIETINIDELTQAYRIDQSYIEILKNDIKISFFRYI